MKKFGLIVLALAMCIGLSSCTSKAEELALSNRYENEVDPLIIGGEEVSVEDFLIEKLKEYINSEDFIEKQQEYENLGGGEPRKFIVTDVIEVQIDGLGSPEYSAHFVGIKADWDWGADGVKYTDTVLAVSYVTGEIRSEFEYDKNEKIKKNSWEECWRSMLKGPLVGTDYNGGTIISKSETRNILSEEAIARINEAIHE